MAKPNLPRLVENRSQSQQFADLFPENLSEFLIRKRLYAGELPEYLTELAEALIIRAGSERQCRSDWQQLADLLHTWQRNQANNSLTASGSGWRLFRLCQHLGMNAAHIQTLDKTDLEDLLALLDSFTITERSKAWLNAYEHHYREAFFMPCKPITDVDAGQSGNNVRKRKSFSAWMIGKKAYAAIWKSLIPPSKP